MAGRSPVEGGRALLFERLVDLEPDWREAKAFILHDRAGMKASVAAELERLLSTRAPLPAAALAGCERSTIDYGIPDACVITPADPGDRATLARQIADAIGTFEPRLVGPVVELRLAGGRGDALIADISGHLAVDDLLEPVSFAIALGEHHGG